MYKTHSEKAIFVKFRMSLPTYISNDTIERAISVSRERIRGIFNKDSVKFLLDEKILIEIENEYFNGDIHVYSESLYGISWVFDKSTGELHTT